MREIQRLTTVNLLEFKKLMLVSNKEMYKFYRTFCLLFE